MSLPYYSTRTAPKGVSVYDQPRSPSALPLLCDSQREERRMNLGISSAWGLALEGRGLAVEGNNAPSGKYGFDCIIIGAEWIVSRMRT